KKNVQKKFKKSIAELKKGGMFAPAKKGKCFFCGVHFRGGFLGIFWGRKKNSKKKIKSIAGFEKGFYICTRKTRKRVLQREEKFIDILN
ncbi:hypothetical protein WJN01_15330, partial [Flavobacteriaceae bacterium SZ-1-7]|uniref:hypothetical protein n=1 Tax=Tamlana sedimenti TaxID=3134126 RepID=UPI0031270D50